MSYKINSRFRRFGYGMGQITGMSAYHIGDPTMLLAALANLRDPKIWLDWLNTRICDHQPVYHHHGP